VLRISVPITLGVRRLNALITEYARACPDIKIDLAFSDRDINIEEEGYDLVIRTGDQPTTPGNWKKISSVGFLICASPVYLTHNGEPWELDELKNHNCLTSNLSPEKTTWILRDRANKEHSIVVSGNFASENCEALREAAVNHLGVAMLPMYLIDDDLRRMRLKQIVPSYSVPPQVIYAMYPRLHILSSKVQTLINFLGKKLGDSPEWNRRLYGVVNKAGEIVGTPRGWPTR
jgi:DNA-binding transcriptional LysR family regulator